MEKPHQISHAGETPRWALIPGPSAPKALKAAQLTPEMVETKGDVLRFVLPSGCGFQCLCCSSFSELTGLWSEK